MAGGLAELLARLPGLAGLLGGAVPEASLASQLAGTGAGEAGLSGPLLGSLLGGGGAETAALAGAGSGGFAPGQQLTGPTALQRAGDLAINQQNQNIVGANPELQAFAPAPIQVPNAQTQLAGVAPPAPSVAAGLQAGPDPNQLLAATLGGVGLGGALGGAGSNQQVAPPPAVAPPLGGGGGGAAIPAQAPLPAQVAPVAPVGVGNLGIPPELLRALLGGLGQV